MTLFILTISAFLSAIVSGVAGMAGGILLLGVMSFFFPLSIIIPVHGLVQLVSNFSRAWILRRHLELKIIAPIALGVPLGGFLAYFILGQLGSSEWFLLLILVIIIYVLFKPKKLPEIRLGKVGFFILAVVAGTMGPLVGATGPLLAPFFIRSDLEQRTMVSTKAASQILIHIVKIPIFLSLEFQYLNHALLIGSMAIAVVLGTKVGTIILSKTAPRNFKKIVKCALLIIALRLTWKLAKMLIT